MLVSKDAPFGTLVFILVHTLVFREKERASPAGAGKAFKDDDAAWGATADHPTATPEESRKAKNHADRNAWAFVDEVLDFEVEIDSDLDLRAKCTRDPNLDLRVRTGVPRP